MIRKINLPQWAAVGGLLLCTACSVGGGDGGRAATPAPIASGDKLPLLGDFYTDKARYNPGDEVKLTLELSAASADKLAGGKLLVQYRSLGDTVASRTFKGKALQAGESGRLTWSWTPPKTDGAGYSVEAWMVDASGRAVDHLNTAVDVSSDWTKYPRYGYLSAYPARDTAETEAIVGQLARYHLNALQFYDWQAKHHVPLAGTPQQPADEWPDIANRPTSGKTVRASIDAAHKLGMAAMNYNLLYGAYDDYASDGSGAKKEWGLFPAPGGEEQDAVPLPDGWATPKIDLFDPGNAAWQSYLIGREKDVFAAYPFDGWHVDQLGFRGMMYTYDGKEIEPSASFAPFLQRARAELGKTVIFNNVGGYGANAAVANETAAMYEEMWENSGQTTYNDLKTVLDEAARLTNGRKATVLAAYMNYNYGNQFGDGNPGEFNEPGVLLTEATILASGGSHIELGDDMQMLDNEYFPNRHLRMNDSLKRKLLDYYNFLTANETILQNGQQPIDRRIAIEGVPTSPDGQTGTIWAFSRGGGTFETLQLINLVGAGSNQWRDTDATAAAPETQRDLNVKLYTDAGSRVKRMFLASPDLEEGTARPVSFETGSDESGSYLAFRVPELRYWDMIGIEYR